MVEGEDFLVLSLGLGARTVAMAMRVSGGDEDSDKGSSMDLHGGVKGGGAEEEAKAEDEGGLLSVATSSTMHPSFFQIGVWCTIISLVHHRTRLVVKLKFSPIHAVLEGKRVAIVDDSI